MTPSKAETMELVDAFEGAVIHYTLNGSAQVRVVEARQRLLAALSRSQDRSEGVGDVEAERERIVAWLRAQSDEGADWGLAFEKGTTRRAAFGGGSLALSRAADAIAEGSHLGDKGAAPARELGPPCENCGHPVAPGQVVLPWDDVGEMHVDCEHPYSLKVERGEEEPEPVVLLGEPMLRFPLAALGSQHRSPPDDADYCLLYTYAMGCVGLLRELRGHFHDDGRTQIIRHELIARVDDALASKFAASPPNCSPPDGMVPVAFPYQRTFNAIAAATSIIGGNIAISVLKFQEAFNSASPSAPSEGRGE